MTNERRGMTSAQVTMLLLVVLPAILVSSISAHYLFQDWAALIRAFQTFEKVTAHGDARSIQVAYDYQSVYRTNCFADGVGVLGGLIMLSIGIVGICLCSNRGRSSS